jgi:predicted anti-sigma-YlaC factor YlaD
MSDTRNHPSSGTEPSGRRSSALAGYRWLLLAFLLAGCVQIFLAGLGVFSFGDHDVAGGTSAFDAHRTLGFTMARVAVIILVLAVIARPDALAVVLCGVLVVQTTLLQSLLAGLADNAALYGACTRWTGFSSSPSPGSSTSAHGPGRERPSVASSRFPHLARFRCPSNAHRTRRR